jgi:shikimate dehydrogenase
MKKYLVIGNPIDHSLSPRLHNYWFKENNIDAAYEKKEIKENDIEGIISEMRNGKIDGINVTVPFKKSVIPFLDELDNLAKKTQSVNTIYKDKNKVIGTNTDILGFKLSLSSTKFLSLKIKNEVKGKKILILGAGGVTSSIIFALEQMEASTIMLSNRTKEKAENLKKLFPQLELVEWGNIKNFDIIINATSLGLKESDKIPINYDQIGSGKLFYDVIYNPSKTNFLLEAEKRGHQIKNGKMMFVYQAQEAFRRWTIAPNQWIGLLPPVNKKVLQLLEND